MGSETVLRDEEKATPDYLAQLLKDKRQIQPFCTVFMHLERILDEEIDRVRQLLFNATKNPSPLELPEESGPIVVLSEKLYVPAAEYPEFNFVGRILGPRGMTAKQLEQDTGCRIMVRGRGSTRDRKRVREDGYKGRSSWEHLNDDLHVLITSEDTEERAKARLVRAVQEVQKLLVPAPEGEDDLKKLQLMELAIINGTYRDAKHQQTTHLALPAPPMPMIGGPALIMPPQIIRTSGPAGLPIILAPRLPVFAPGSPPILSPPVLPNGSMPPPPLMSPHHEGPGVIFHVELTSEGLPSPIIDYTSPPIFASVPSNTFLNHPINNHNHHHNHNGFSAAPTTVSFVR